jgi:hypothetical protein
LAAFGGGFTWGAVYLKWAYWKQKTWTLDVRKIRYILKWSSAKFYETGEDEFYFLTHYTERF